MIMIDRLRAGGATVIIIEHNLDVIKLADYIVDLGPCGGEKGGNLIFQGTPEELVKVDESATGEYLKHYLK
jgi:excinuclease ABC subunit A